MKFGEYFRENMWGILFRFGLLVLPVLTGGIILTIRCEWLDWFATMPEYEYRYYGILIVLILMALVPVLLNLASYFNDYSRVLKEYSGKSESILFAHRFSGYASFAIVIILVGFGTLIISRALNFQSIIEWNRYISLIIFGLFLVMDLLLVRQENLAAKEWSSPDETLASQSELNKRFSIDSTLLINIPTVLIVLLSIFFAHNLVEIGYFKKVLNVADQQLDESISRLFTSGLETGILMTSIIFSQFVFFIIKTKWEYRTHLLHSYKKKTP